MNNIQKFLRRVKGGGGTFRVQWSEEDLYRLGEIYGLDKGAVNKALAGVTMATSPTPRAKPPVSKSASELPVRWNYIATDGKPDRVSDVVHVAGLDLTEFRNAPTWHAQHDLSRPIGSSLTTDKVGGKLVGVMELAPEIYPEAIPLQKAIAAGHHRGVSIQFQPTRWAYDKSRDGVDFFEARLIEISACSIACNAGSYLYGPAKSLQQRAAELRAENANYYAQQSRRRNAMFGDEVTQAAIEKRYEAAKAKMARARS